MYVCMYIYFNVCKYVCIYVDVLRNEPMGLYTRVCMYVCMYIYVCIYVCYYILYMHGYVRMYVLMNASIKRMNASKNFPINE